MRKISIYVAKPGEKVARDIFTDHGNILLRAGRLLNPLILDRLKKNGIDTVYIEDEMTEDIRPFETLSQEVRLETLNKIKETMVSVSDHPGVGARAAEPKFGTIFRNIFKQLLGDMSGKGTMMVNLADLYVKDDYLFHQSLNVAALSIIIGVSKGFNERQLEDLGVGALLADIGMIRLSKNLWNKNTVLTEEERWQLHEHPELGYQFLRQQEDISMISALCAKQHHERFDGNGYPQGLKGNEIHEFSQIIAIADVYSALTSTRKHRQRYSPGEALEYLYAVGNAHFDISLIQKFTSQIAVYPVASTVMLNTGEMGVIVSVQPSLTTRPLVRIIRERNGVPVVQPRDLDLARNHNVTIVNTL